MRKGLVLFAILFVAVFGDEPAGEKAKEDWIASEHASYDGSALKLSGDVVLDHLFGVMKAQEAVLDKTEVDSDFPFCRLRLKQKVALQLPSNASLVCDEAKLDFSTLDAEFRAEGNEKVHFADNLVSKSGKKRSFSFEAPVISMKIGSYIIDKKKELVVDRIEIQEGSTLRYDESIIIEAPKAVFHKAAKANAKNLYGEIYAFADGDRKCRLLQNQDVIEASKIQFDMIQEMIAMADAKGCIQSFKTSEGAYLLDFSCNTAFWDHMHEVLTLLGNVKCSDETVGQYRSQEKMRVSFIHKDGKKEIGNILTEGPVHLVLNNSTQDAIYEFYCPGKMEVKAQELQIFLQAKPGSQISYHHPDGILYANKAHVDYCLEGGKFKPTTLHLKGSVYLVGQGDKASKFCLADRLQVNFETESMILHAEGGKRVLFWDESKGVKISAPEVHITRDPKTHEEQVRGIGNVRFAFTDQEREIIQKVIPSQVSTP